MINDLLMINNLGQCMTGWLKPSLGLIAVLVLLNSNNLWEDSAKRLESPAWTVLIM